MPDLLSKLLYQLKNKLFFGKSVRECSCSAAGSTEPESVVVVAFGCSCYEACHH